MEPQSTAVSATRRPSLAFRLGIFLKHGSRILFNRYPGYTFDDLAAIQDCLDGPAFQRMARSMRADPVGARILQERPCLEIATVDWAWLSSLPIDSLGYNFWHHFYANGILQEITLGEPVVRWDEQTEFVKRRYRVTHDLRHVLLGIGIEGYEEVLIQTFQFAQQPQILSAAIVIGGGLMHALIDRKLKEIVSLVPHAWRAGKQAKFLSNLYCEELWETPLEEVRRMLNITPIGDRYPVQQRHPDAPWTSQQQREHLRQDQKAAS